jgi:hypothetical protein
MGSCISKDEKRHLELMCKGNSGPGGVSSLGGGNGANGQFRGDGDHSAQRPSLSNMMLSGSGSGANGPGQSLNNSNLSGVGGKLSNSNLPGNHRHASSAQNGSSATEQQSRSGSHALAAGGQVAGQQTVIALYTYQAKDEGDLSFKKGDRLLILDDKDPDWWLARHVGQIKSGYIPRNYVVAQAIQTEEYGYFTFLNDKFKPILSDTNDLMSLSR